jgi:hypothetical protein
VTCFGSETSRTKGNKNNRTWLVPLRQVVSCGSRRLAHRKADTFGVGYFYFGVHDPQKDLAPLLLPFQDENGVELY